MKDLLVPRELQDLLVLLVTLEQLELQVHKANLVLLDHRELLAHKALKVFKAIKVFRALLELQALLGRLEPQVQQEMLDLLDLLEPRAQQVLLVRLVQQVLMV